MAFKTEEERLDAVRLWLGTVPKLAGLFRGTGASDEAVRLLEEVKGGGGELSHGQAVMLRVAFDLWNGFGHVEFQEVLYTLDPDRISMLGELLKAYGSNEVAAWVKRHRLSVVG